MKYEHSLGTWSDRGSDRKFEQPMTQCAHCQRHFPHPRFDDTPEGKASRIGRGICFKCNAYMCSEACAECIPREKKLDIADSGKNPTAVSVAVPHSPLWLPE